MSLSALELLELPLAPSVTLKCVSTSSGSYFTLPVAVKFWDDCEEVVVAAVDAGISDLTVGSRFDDEAVLEAHIASEGDARMALQTKCLHRVLLVLQDQQHQKDSYHFASKLKCKPVPDSVPSGIPEVALIKLAPDIRDAAALVVIQAALTRTITETIDVVEAYNAENREIQHVIAQLTSLLWDYGTEFGVLTSFERTWLVQAVQGTSGEAVVLRISNPIAYDATGFTASKALYGLSLLAISRQGDDGFGRGPRHPPYFPAPRASTHSMVCRGRSANPGSTNNSSIDPGTSNMPSNSGSTDDHLRIWSAQQLHLGEMLGWGRDGVVKEGLFAGQRVALKFIVPELAESPAAAVASLNAELHAYAALTDIQGTAIPHLLGTGLFRNNRGTLCTFLALERIVGHALASEQNPSEQDGRAAQQALRAMHKRGFVHGDLSDDNIILTHAAGGADGARLIDFVDSISGAPYERLKAEEKELARLFATKGVTLKALKPALRRTWPKSKSSLYTRERII